MEKHKKYPWLDWVRFLAAFIVVIAHSRHLMFVTYSELEPSSKGVLSILFYGVGKLGNEAVLVFFVLSGFLVGGKAIDNIQNNTFKLYNYTIDRFTRIMIPLVPAIGLTVVTQLYIAGDINSIYVLGNLFSLQGIFVPHLVENEALWTLSYEVWFYIGIGAVGLFTIHKPIGIILLSICGLVFTQLFPHYLICWLIGAAAFIWRPEKLSYKLLFISLVLLIYGIIGRQVGRGTEAFDIEFLSLLLPTEEISRVIFSGGFALFVQQIILMKPTRFLLTIENTGVALASFSYTLYLTHFPVIRLFGDLFPVADMNEINIYSFAIYISLVLCCLLTAMCMYWLFERNTKLVRNLLKHNS